MYTYKGGDRLIEIIYKNTCWITNQIHIHVIKEKEREGGG